MKKRKKIGILAILFLGLGFTACEEYPSESDYVLEQLVSVTNYDTGVNFYDAKYKNFVLSDSVTYVNDDVITRVAIAGNPELQSVATSVRENLKALGYAESNEVNADMGITLTVAKNTTYYVSYPWWWYSDWCYWDYWSCGWFPPYYPYPYPVVVGGYTSGTLAMDMFDLTKTNDTTKRTAMWTGLVRGLLVGDRTAAEVDSAIDDCFNQTVAFQK